MKVFIAVVDEGSLLGASRRLRRSPAAVSRAIAQLEAHVGVALLHRTTRSVKLSRAGERYAAACRKVMIDLNDADFAAAEEICTPCGTVILSAPTMIGEDVLRPMLAAFMDLYPDIRVNLLLADHPVNLIEQGVDVALRLGRLGDSSFIGFRLGEVRKIIVASPGYLSRHAQIRVLTDLSVQQIIALADFGLSAWDFPVMGGSRTPRVVSFSPRLVVNTARAAVASAIDGHGVTRLFSYHVEAHVRNGDLTVLLAAEQSPAIPVHLVTPKSRLALPKIRLLIDFVTPQLRAYFGNLQKEIEQRSASASEAGTDRRMLKTVQRPRIVPRANAYGGQSTPAMAGGT